MTWLVWRQYRLQAAAAAVLLAGFAAVMVVSGLQMASQWHTMLGTCTTSVGHSSCEGASLGGTIGHDFEVLSVMVPAVLGIFFGAPLVAHELESGTSQYAWTQTVTRARWLTVKAGWLLLAAAVWGGAVAALVTWWSGPRNALLQNALQANTFDMQGLVPVGYSVFATALGIAAGAVLRRTLPAVAIVIGGFIGMRLWISQGLRMHFMSPLTTYYSLTANFIPPAGSVGVGGGIVNKSGQVVAQQFGSFNIDGVAASSLPAICQKLIPASAYGPGGGASNGTVNAVLGCMQRAGYREFYSYQPMSRFWAFQGIETGVFVALAAALIAVTFVVVRGRDA